VAIYDDGGANDDDVLFWWFDDTMRNDSRSFMDDRTHTIRDIRNRVELNIAIVICSSPLATVLYNVYGKILLSDEIEIVFFGWTEEG
jgi:hypothetical protein